MMNNNDDINAAVGEGKGGAEPIREEIHKTCRQLAVNDSTVTYLNLNPCWSNRIINKTKINTSELELIVTSLRRNQYLKQINFGDFGCSDKAVMIVAAVIPHTVIQAVRLYNNNIGPKGAVALAEACKHESCVVEELDLSNNNIKDEGAIAFANVFKTKAIKLKVLYLRLNKIGDKGAITLFEGLVAGKDYCALEQLWLSENLITNKGAIKISPLLKQLNHHLKTICLLDNKINSDGHKILIRNGLQHNYNITRFGCGYKYISEKSDEGKEGSFYLKFNNNNRRLIFEQNKMKSFKPYIWALVLSKKLIKDEDTPSMMYYLLRENPHILEHA